MCDIINKQNTRRTFYFHCQSTTQIFYVKVLCSCRQKKEIIWISLAWGRYTMQMTCNSLPTCAHPNNLGWKIVPSSILHGTSFGLSFDICYRKVIQKQTHLFRHWAYNTFFLPFDAAENNSQTTEKSNLNPKIPNGLEQYKEKKIYFQAFKYNITLKAF